nr:MAG TPA: hypothetical protein [Caudoviricetes sp.]
MKTKVSYKGFLSYVFHLGLKLMSIPKVCS